jgi:hypothetical protein
MIKRKMGRRKPLRTFQRRLVIRPTSQETLWEESLKKRLIR